MEDSIWGAVTKFYRDKFNIEADVVSLLSDLDVLLLCASGSSVLSIASFLELDADVVKAVIKKYFDFDGWNDPLCINPVSIYKNLDVLNYNNFKLESQRHCEYRYSDEELQKMFDISAIFVRLEEIINEKWI